MKDKYYNSISSLILGIVLVIISIILFKMGSNIYIASVDFVIFIFFIMFILDIVNLVSKWNNKKKRDKLIGSSIFHLGTCVVFLIIPNLFYGLAPVLFSIYLCLIGISQFAMCWVVAKNGEFIKLRQFLIGIVCFVIAFPIFINPVMKLDRFILLIACYMGLLGLYYLYDFIMLVIPIKTKNRLKRRIRITLPKIIEAIIPYSVMLEINRNLEIREVSSYAYEKINKESDLNILIHTSNRGVNRMGHMDIYFEGKVISYGNYDEGSRFGREFFGDGVLFIAENKADYINFCIDNSKKTVFDFGIALNDKQKKRIRERIDELCSNTVSWNYKDDKKYNDGNSYASKLYKRTKAKFYKFKRGKYRTYFVLGTNCCYIVDDIVGKSGMDILSMNGIITPGTYYDYLNRELNDKDSNVISKDVYNSSYRAS